MAHRGDLALGVAAGVVAGAWWGLVSAWVLIGFESITPVGQAYTLRSGPHWWWPDALTVFLGTGVVCGALGTFLLRDPGRTEAGWRVRWVAVGLFAAPATVLVMGVMLPAGTGVTGPGGAPPTLAMLQGLPEWAGIMGLMFLPVEIPLGIVSLPVALALRTRYLEAVHAADPDETDEGPGQEDT